MNNHPVLKYIVPQLADKEKDTASTCMERENLRERLKLARTSMPPDKCGAWSIAAQKALLTHELFKEARSIALYMPIRGEIGTDLLLALNGGKTVYMPRTLKNRLMEFAPINGLDDLETGNFGIMEPKKLIPGFGPEEFAPDLMLVPGLAFDLAGNRLGFGGGYYDRFLGARQNTWPLVGFCYGFQIVDALKSMPWDCKMDYIFSENGCHEVKK